MRVVIRADVLADAGHWNHLDRIILRIQDEFHEWDVEDPEVIDKSAWMQQGRSYHKELFEKAAKRSTYPTRLHRRRVVVTFFPVSVSEVGLPPAQAALFLATPLTILVENRFTDGLFCETVLEFLGPSELTDFRHNVPDALRFDSGGGSGELPKLIEDYVAKAKRDGHPVRAVVVTDSDGKRPGDCSQHVHRIREACDRNAIPCMVLKKRTIENYIPDEIIGFRSDKPDLVAALFRLTPEQRDHFPMKNGLKETVSLYDSVSSEERQVLTNGFGGDVINLLTMYKTTISREGLRQRDGRHELEELVNMIVKEI